MVHRFQGFRPVRLASALLCAPGLLSGCGFDCLVCTATPAGGSAPGPERSVPEDFHDDLSCGALYFQNRIGARLIGAEDYPAADGSTVRAGDFPAPRRLAPAGAPVRLGEHPERINIFLNDRGEVVRITCG